MVENKIYSIQPRFRITSPTTQWSMVENILGKFGTDNIPSYGTIGRDIALSVEWMNEPMIAGAFSTWVEKLQTVNWRIIGGRNQAKFFATMFNKADQGRGWSYFNGVRGLQYLTTDKGIFTELGRVLFVKEIEEKYARLNELISSGSYSPLDTNKALDNLHNQLTLGKVSGIQHIDSTRMHYMGIPRFSWRFFPEQGNPVSYPDDNILQITSLPSPLDKYRGHGFCALSRLLDMKKLMVGYLLYFRQEIGNLPPELAIIINGLSDTYVRDSLNRYEQEKKSKGLDEYGKIWWMGSDDPSAPVSMSINNLLTPNKSFDYKSIVEIWAKAIALNTGEDVGEFWLIQHSGAVKGVQSIQAMKSRGKGVARFMQEDERLFNLYVLPFGSKFEYDNKDDDQDRQRAEILAIKIGNLKELAAIGADREDPAYTIDQVRDMAKEWEVVPSDMDDQGPAVIGSVLKSMYDDQIIVDNNMNITEIKPLLRGKLARDAEYVYNVLKDSYESVGRNGISNGSVKDKELIT